MATKAKKKPAVKPAAVPLGDVLTLAEAAAYLRVDAGALQADAVVGRVPGQFVAGEWRFRRPALVAWLGMLPRPSLLDLPVPNETPEEQEAFLEQMRVYRKASGKVRGGRREPAA